MESIQLIKYQNETLNDSHRFCIGFLGYHDAEAAAAATVVVAAAVVGVATVVAAAVGVAEDHVVALTVAAGSSDLRSSLPRSWLATSSSRCSAAWAGSPACEHSVED